MEKISVGILGATGMVGQQYLQLLVNHPWFEVSFLASSEQSAGKFYGEAVEGRWHMNAPIPDRFINLPITNINDIQQAKKSCSFVFSAISHEAAGLYEELYAQNGIPVISNAAYHRYFADVPVLIPEVNPDHIKLIPIQQKNRKWDRGFIVAKPNCSLQSYMIPLAPLHKEFVVQKLLITTLQAVSGAGHPGVSSLGIIDNVIPYISNEEEKSEQEPLKIWGDVGEDGITDSHNITISAHCNRVPVIDGHLACVSVQFEFTPLKKHILELWENFQGLPQLLNLPSAPRQPIIYCKESDRPQPRQDRNAGNGMSVSVGRLRDCNVFNFRFVALSHNTIRGAAGGGILNAELLMHQGYLK
ncbi:MAG: aspartate-semialdehyde dehydrogenase [Parachlamydiaceae bacterium]|nr:aspartate-semialdehyde dehydrogenase [Parachlamydiaceae bacterium]